VLLHWQHRLRSMILPLDIKVPTYRSLGTLSPNGRYACINHNGPLALGSIASSCERPLTRSSMSSFFMSKNSF